MGRVGEQAVADSAVAGPVNPCAGNEAITAEEGCVTPQPVGRSPPARATGAADDQGTAMGDGHGTQLVTVASRAGRVVSG